MQPLKPENRYAVVTLGAVDLTLPARVGREPRKAMLRILAANSAGLTAAGNRWAQDLAGHHFAAAQRNRQLLEDALKRQALARPEEAAAPITEANRKTMRQAEEAMAAAERLRLDGRRGDALDKLVEARDLMTAAGAERDRRTERLERHQAFEEMTALAQLRGEEIIEERATAFVDVQVEGGFIAQRAQAVTRIRNTSRDGLETLSSGDRPAISTTQFAAGMLYRALYEDADPDRGLGSCMGGGGGGGRVQTGASPYLAVLAKERAQMARRIDASVAVERIEATIKAGDRSYVGPHGISELDKAGRRVMVLREVAGKANTLRSIATSGSAQVKLTVALRHALDICADHFGIH